jgi:quercetin dioxygenase-like cupin family protein
VTGDAIVLPPGEGERHEREHAVVTLLADLPTLSACEIAFDPPYSVEPHAHDDHVDAFYVLEGEVEFTLADRTVSGGPGTFVAAPIGTVHGFRTPGPGRARMLNFHGPDAGFVEMVRRTTLRLERGR